MSSGSAVPGLELENEWPIGLLEAATRSTRAMRRMELSSSVCASVGQFVVCRDASKLPVSLSLSDSAS